VPKPVKSELKLPLKRIHEAMASGKRAEARLLIMQLVSQHPNVGRVRYLLGNLEFAEKNVQAGLEAYAEALRLDPGLRGDAALLVNLRGVLGDRRFGRDALDMMTTQIGKPAGAILAQVASEDQRSEFRHAARGACDTLGCAGQIDKVQSYGLDLRQIRGCDERRAVVQKLMETGDARAIAPLKKARARAGVLSDLFGGGNGCIRKDIDAALTALGHVEPRRTRR